MNKSIEQIKKEAVFVQSKLQLLVLLYDYIQSFEKFDALRPHYSSLSVFKQLIDQRLVLEAALLIDLKGNFNILTPINSCAYNSFLEKPMRIEVQKIVSEIKRLSESPKAIKIKEIRDWYLAHSDLNTRQNRVIHLNKLNEFNQELIKLFNQFTEIISLPRVSPKPYQYNSLNHMFEVLRNHRDQWEFERQAKKS